MTEADLVKERVRQNAKIIKKLRQDEHADELHKLAGDDAALGRMSAPRHWRPRDSVEATLCPRFGVEQGEGGCHSLTLSLACCSAPALWQVLRTTVA